MAFFNVDDQFHGHPKARKAGLAAVGLWTVAGSHCRAYKSDGFIPDWFVANWPQGKRLASQLVAAGLWIECDGEGEQGYRFHDWMHLYDDPEETERQRQQGRERQRRRRQRLREEKGTDA